MGARGALAALLVAARHARTLEAMTSPLDSRNPHGIRVAADRAPVRADVKAAFARGSRKAAREIEVLTKPRSAGSAHRSARS